MKLKFQSPLVWLSRSGMGPKNLHFYGSSLAVQGLRLGAFTAGAQVQSLAGS